MASQAYRTREDVLKCRKYQCFPPARETPGGCDGAPARCVNAAGQVRVTADGVSAIRLDRTRRTTTQHCAYAGCRDREFFRTAIGPEILRSRVCAAVARLHRTVDVHEHGAAPRRE